MKSVADSVVDVDADIEEVGGAHSNYLKKAKGCVQVEEVERIHVAVQQCAFQVHLVNIVDVTAHDPLLLYRLGHQCHNSLEEADDIQLHPQLQVDQVDDAAAAAAAAEGVADGEDDHQC